MAGHVFVVRSDLRRLALDAWLLPCGIHAEPLQSWVDGDLVLSWPLPPPEWRAHQQRSFEVQGVDPRRATPWLTHVGGGYRVDVDWFMDGVREFLTRVAARLGGKSRLDRPRPIVGLPVVGTGAGGAQKRTGEIVRAQLAVMVDAARDLDLDCVLVTWDGPTHAAAQAERRRLFAERGDPEGAWPELGPELARVARSLGHRAKEGEAVLFLGAGVSAGAGLPLWGKLLGELAQAAGLTADEQAGLRGLDPLDQAQLVQRRLPGGHADLAALVARLVHGREHSLSHALLACLPVGEVVTTNYDTLFEQASEAAGVDGLAVLPWATAEGARRWVLKMHGSVEHPEDIVLTREDYLRYGARRAALAGVVQALLITRHVVFVGFSLVDDNFHRIADAVRQAVPGDEHPPRGTALMLGTSPLLSELWRPDLDLVSIPGSVRDAARLLEVLLDRVLAEAVDASSHLRDRRYDALLTDADREVAGVLSDLEASLDALSPAAKATRAAGRLRALLETFGRTGSAKQAPRGPSR